MEGKAWAPVVNGIGIATGMDGRRGAGRGAREAGRRNAGYPCPRRAWESGSPEPRLPGPEPRLPSIRVAMPAQLPRRDASRIVCPMPPRDPRIDAYIARSADFAQPILAHLRDLVHAACPDVEEGIKWGMPHFLYRGGILCGMAAFKRHCTFGFWKGAQVLGEASRAGEAMGQLGCLTSVDDVPPRKVFTGWVRAAMALRDQVPAAKARTPRGAKPAARKAARPALPVPPYLAAALAKHAKARATFEAFPPSHRREYIEWLTDAKTEATREKRLATTIEWLGEGKGRNWKYER